MERRPTDDDRQIPRIACIDPARARDRSDIKRHQLYYGVCLAVSGKRDEAIQQFKKIAQMDPTFPWAHSFLSRIYVWNGDHAAAVEERAKAQELDGKPESARLLRESFASGGWDDFLRESARQGAEVGSVASLGSVDGADKEVPLRN